jgi:ribosomal-protein-alanine acetyltransferase
MSQRKKPKSAPTLNVSRQSVELKIETATIKLLDKLYEIEKQSFGREAFTKQQIAYLLTDYNAIGLAARIDGEIAGFAIARIDVGRSLPFGHILTIDVSPSHRRKGIAKQLLQKIEALLEEKGVKECRLEVREDNVSAINLYQKLGYKKVGKLEKYYQDAHGLYLRKTL